jgi:hypothetical protein
MQAVQNHCCISFLMPAQMPNKNVFGEVHTHLSPWIMNIKKRVISMFLHVQYTHKTCTIRGPNAFGHHPYFFGKYWIGLKADCEKRNAAVLLYCLHSRLKTWCWGAGRLPSLSLFANPGFSVSLDFFKRSTCMYLLTLLQNFSIFWYKLF